MLGNPPLTKLAARLVVQHKSIGDMATRDQRR